LPISFSTRYNWGVGCEVSMKDIAFFMQATGGLHMRTSDRSPAFKEVVDRIVAIAKMSASELSLLMGTEKGGEIAKVDFDGENPEKYLRSWDSNQCLKHPCRIFPLVVAIRELINVLLSMLRRNADMRADDAPCYVPH
jgi:hypothetical protein